MTQNQNEFDLGNNAKLVIETGTTEVFQGENRNINSLQTVPCVKCRLFFSAQMDEQKSSSEIFSLTIAQGQLSQGLQDLWKFLGDLEVSVSQELKKQIGSHIEGVVEQQLFETVRASGTDDNHTNPAVPQTREEMQQALQELPFSQAYLVMQYPKLSRKTWDALLSGETVSDKKFQAFRTAFAEAVPHINSVNNHRAKVAGALRTHLGLPEDFADWDNLAANEKAQELHKKNRSFTYNKMERLLTGKSVEWQTVQLFGNALYDATQAPDSAERNLGEEAISPHLRLQQSSVSK